MAILTKIRNRAGLAVGFVGFALLAFVVSDAINNNVNIFRSSANNIGSVNGKAISFKDFDNTVRVSEYDYMVGRDVKELDQQTKDMVREQAWQNVIDDNTYTPEYEKLGIANVTSEELFEMLTGKYADPMVLQSFKDPKTGSFNPGDVIRYMKTMDQDPEGKAKGRWMVFEKGLLKTRQNSKYSALVKAGVYATSLDAEESFKNRNRTINFKFAALSYNTIADSSIKPTDDDYKKYFDAHSYKYKQEPMRDLKFAMFEINPSAEDSAIVLNEVNNYYQKFKEAKNDSEFIAQNAGTGIDTTYYPIGKLDKAVEDSLFFANVGKITGPYFSNGSYKLAKLISVKADSLFTMRASHILIKPKGNTLKDTLDAMNEANGYLAEIKKGKDFAEMARLHGTDGTAQNGGDLNWFREGQMVKEFNDAVKIHNKGDLYVVKSQFGVHIVKVTENKTKRLVRVAKFEKAIEASSITSDSIEKIANTFKSKVSNPESFEKVAAEMNINLRVAKDLKSADKFVAGLDNPKELIRWAYDNKKGSISDVMTFGNKFAVSLITGLREKGIPQWQDVKEQIEEFVKNAKKAEDFKKRFEKALPGSNSIVDLCIKLHTVAQEAPNQMFENNNVPYAGDEKVLVGTAFGMKPGKFSKIVVGDHGVYVVFVDNINEAQNTPKDFKDLQKELIQTLRGSTEYQSRNSIRDKADIEDNRYKFY